MEEKKHMHEKKEEVVETKEKFEEKKEQEIKDEKKTEEKIKDEKEEKKDEKIIKKDKAVVNGKNIAISTKHSKFICRFIKNDSIDKAIEKMEKVLNKKIFVPMTGEYPHRKGRTGKTGRYPEKACKEFIKLLKSLKANASVNLIDNPFISKAMANIASRPYKRHGSGRAKRTNVYLEAREKIEKEHGEK